LHHGIEQNVGLMTLLAKKPVFVVTLAVLFTTLFSWFQTNSWCIILLLICGLWVEGPVKAIRTAFTNKYFLAYFIYWLIQAAGLFYTHNPVKGQNLVAKDTTLVAIAFVLCGCRFADEKGYRSLITAYSLLVFASALYCLYRAEILYVRLHDSSVFFYHPLAAPLSQNAVFYSVYVLFAMQFLLSPEGDPAIGLSAPVRKWCRILLVVFFLGMIVLLSSKLILILALLMLVNFFGKRYYTTQNLKALVISGLAAICLVAGLFAIDNPVKQRFTKMVDGGISVPKRDTINAATAFDPLPLRILEWHFAFEILREHHAWLFGVSPGDSQDLLDQKYVDTHMWIGNPDDGPDRRIRGFLGYNFHDQYIETLVRSGLIGFASLMLILGLQIGIALKWRTKEARFTVLTLILFFIPESPLTMQHGVFLFCFFPLLLLYSRRKVPIMVVKQPDKS
jgi:O-antigen ligase